jgi:type IV secretory pathway protease TraF
MLERPDPALRDWAAALGRARARRRLTVRGAVVASACLGLLATVIAPPLPRLVWNASASMPVGLYRVIPGAAVRVGDIAIAWAPSAVRELAAGRGYLPADVPLVKRVAAVAGARICWHGTALTIDGRLAARRLVFDRRGRLLPWREGCETLGEGDVLLLAPAGESFDGRYFGASARANLIGKAVRLWPR